MDALEMALLFDYYGALLTDKQRRCFDLRYNQDFSLSEIAQDMQVSRQAVCDNLTRTEAILRKMEQAVGYVEKDRRLRSAVDCMDGLCVLLADHADPEVQRIAAHMRSALENMKE